MSLTENLRRLAEETMSKAIAANPRLAGMNQQSPVSQTPPIRTITRPLQVQTQSIRTIENVPPKLIVINGIRQQAPEGIKLQPVATNQNRFKIPLTPTASSNNQPNFVVIQSPQSNKILIQRQPVKNAVQNTIKLQQVKPVPELILRLNNNIRLISQVQSLSSIQHQQANSQAKRDVVHLPLKRNLEDKDHDKDNSKKIKLSETGKIVDPPTVEVQTAIEPVVGIASPMINGLRVVSKSQGVPVYVPPKLPMPQVKVRRPLQRKVDKIVIGKRGISVLVVLLDGNVRQISYAINVGKSYTIKEFLAENDVSVDSGYSAECIANPSNGFDYIVRVGKTKEAMKTFPTDTSNRHSPGQIKIKRDAILKHMEKQKPIEVVRPMTDNKTIGKSKKVAKIQQDGNKEVVLMILDGGRRKVLYVENGTQVKDAIKLADIPKERAKEFECIKMPGAKVEYFLKRKQDKLDDEALISISDALWEQNVKKQYASRYFSKNWN